MTPATVVVEHQGPGSWLARLPEGLALPLSTAGADRTPRVRDVDFARWLGFRVVRNIRRLIRGMEKKGQLRGIDWRSATERQPVGPRGRGVRAFTTDEAWLTREQALLVATQSGTPRAWEITEAMVAVFVAVLDAADPRVPLAELVREQAKVAQLEGRVAEQDLAVAHGTIGPSGSKAIRARLSVITAMETGLRSGPDYNRVWGERQRELALLAKVQRKWAQVALGQRADVYGALDDFERRASRVAAARGRAMQLSLDLH